MGEPPSDRANAEPAITILAVDDHPPLRSGLTAVMAGERDLRLVAEASNGEEAVDTYRAHRSPVALIEGLMRSFRQQLGTDDRTEAVAIAVRRGIPRLD